MAVEEYASMLRVHVPRRDDKLANVLRNSGFPDLAVKMLRLYELRKKADYSSHSVSLDEASESLETAKHIVEVLKSILNV